MQNDDVIFPSDQDHIVVTPGSVQEKSDDGPA